MNTYSNNNLNILDLPDEVLLLIFNELNPIDALYSLVEVNERFDRLVLRALHIRSLDMTNMVIKSYYDRTFSIDNHVLSKICDKVIPRIHSELNELILEQNSIQQILLVSNYPQLESLSLVNFQKEILFQYLTASHDSILHYLLTQQILHLHIDISYDPKLESSEILSAIFTLILSKCQRLISLNFCQMFYDRKTPLHISQLPLTSCTSSTLTKLQVNVATFDDCLYLLKEDLECLSTLIIHVQEISLSVLNTNKKQPQLPKLKCFSLTSVEITTHYDDAIVPLLRRMINLQQLILFLAISRPYSTYIDGTQLHDQILIYMPNLNIFTFSINTNINNKYIKIDVQSNEDIQCSFIGKRYGEVGSCVYTRHEHNVGMSHVYSLPYQFKYFLYLNNSFQTKLFNTVQYLKMLDGRPFEYNLFQLVSQCFPLLKELRVINYQPQKNKQHSSVLIIFPHLILLDLIEVHLDYAEQLLYDRNTHLPALSDLYIKYEPLAVITNNFTENTIRGNCAKLKNLRSDVFEPSEHFVQYFPLLEVSFLLSVL